jgi:hypothetical protein
MVLLVLTAPVIGSYSIHVHCVTAATGQIIITDILSARLSAVNAIPIKHACKFFRCPANHF